MPIHNGSMSSIFLSVLINTLLSLALVFLAIKMTQLFHQYLTRKISINPSLKKRLPGLEQRIQHYRKVFHVIFCVVIYIVVGLVILKIWGGEPSGFSDLLKEVILVKLMSIGAILLVAVLIWEVSNSFIEISLSKNGEDITIESGRAHTLLSVARKVISLTLSLIALLMVLSELGVNIAPLLGGAGVLGLAVSFGGQKLMQDLITGFFMLLENQIAVGDVVNVADKTGRVEAISIRTVRLRDVAGVVHIIPYSSIAIVSNLSKDFSYTVLEVSVAYRENVDEVISVLRQLSLELCTDPDYATLILEPLDVLGLDKFADSAIVIKARLKTKPGSQWQVGREFNRRMKQKFDELDIQIPFPHAVILFGDNKKSTAPSLPKS